MKDAFDANSDDFHVFIDFSGYENLFEIRVYLDGHCEDSKPTYICRSYTQPPPSQ